MTLHKLIKFILKQLVQRYGIKAAKKFLYNLVNQYDYSFKNKHQLLTFIEDSHRIKQAEDQLLPKQVNDFLNYFYQNYYQLKVDLVNLRVANLNILFQYLNHLHLECQWDSANFLTKEHIGLLPQEIKESIIVYAHTPLKINSLNDKNCVNISFVDKKEYWTYFAKKKLYKLFPEVYSQYCDLQERLPSDLYTTLSVLLALFTKVFEKRSLDLEHIPLLVYPEKDQLCIFQIPEFIEIYQTEAFIKIFENLKVFNTYKMIDLEEAKTALSVIESCLLSLRSLYSDIYYVLLISSVRFKINYQKKQPINGYVTILSTVDFILYEIDKKKSESQELYHLFLNFHTYIFSILSETAKLVINSTDSAISFINFSNCIIRLCDKNNEAYYESNVLFSFALNLPYTYEKQLELWRKVHIFPAPQFFISELLIEEEDTFLSYLRYSGFENHFREKALFSWELTEKLAGKLIRFSLSNAEKNYGNLIFIHSLLKRLKYIWDNNNFSKFLSASISYIKIYFFEVIDNPDFFKEDAYRRCVLHYQLQLFLDYGINFWGLKESLIKKLLKLSFVSIKHKETEIFLNSVYSITARKLYRNRALLHK